MHACAHMSPTSEDSSGGTSGFMMRVFLHRPGAGAACFVEKLDDVQGLSRRERFIEVISNILCACTGS